MADGLEKYLEGVLEKLNASEVRAGFLGGSTYPDGTSVTMVAARNEYGDPANNQPPRPFFRNAIAEKQDEWKKSIERGMASGLDAKTVLEVVGAQIKGDIQESIATLVEPALSPVTLKRRRTRKVMPNQSNKPLVDTRVMIGDVNYEVT
ncbi:hypothetical protein WB66_10915 [bacteria symbiont BFo1 of Frankliniella occidentalis]|nr:hypothetical protein AI28_08230 [bacteria symbiont BFo1 of Frankliniella occidentalis]KYP84726.1 hypothetical protein WB66_10915 [bacteria symbiont BFo1 of Frankliniella occidentalis]